MAPKMAGAFHLHTLTAAHPLDFFVLYSSAAALLGSPGQGNYAAANAFLDALSHHRQALGLPALSINWGPFSEVGMASAQASRGERLAYRGLESLTPEQGTQRLGRLLGRGGQLAVMRLKVRHWLAVHRTAAGFGLWSALRNEQDPTTPDEPQAPRFKEALEAHAPEARAALLEQHLAEHLGRALHVAPRAIDRLATFGSLGLDSLMGLEIRNQLEHSLGIKLTATLLFTYPTLSSLAGYILRELALAGSAAEPAPGAPDREEQARQSALQFKEEVAGLSEDQAEALLLESILSIQKGSLQ
jgi:acyl carrier protein